MSEILWPLVTNLIRRNKVSNTYGRFIERKSGAHWGWDFYAKCGTPCYAIADGCISNIYGDSSDTGSFGLVAVLMFAFGDKSYYAAYCHLNAVTVSNQNLVKAGDQIGFTGNSGNASNMSGLDEHLHFEIRTSVRPPPGGKPYRISPLEVFGKCPLHIAIVEP